MPSKSEKQRRFMGAELSRLRSGEKTETSMSEEQLSDYAAKEAFVLSLIDKYLGKDKKNVCPKCGKEGCKGNGIEKVASYGGGGGISTGNTGG
tara:strand:- start:252 stop:530 length:279 start_codon:yes stop_codon:yes gene_type:complete